MPFPNNYSKKASKKNTNLTKTLINKSSTILLALLTVILTSGLSLVSNSEFTKKISQELTSVVFGPKSIAGANNTSTSNCKPNTTTKVNFVRAVDGDTIEVSGYCNDKIRMLYVDTPETVKPNTQVQCYGQEASLHTKSLFINNQELYLNTDKGAQDQYGRALAIVYLDQSQAINNNIEQSINYKLVLQGFAKAKFYSPNTTYKQQILQAEQIAKSKNQGLWKNC
jgi:micrococcal nuclease